MRNITHKIFIFSLIVKAINGLFELFGGFLFLFLRSPRFSDFLLTLVQGELGEDPTDPFVFHVFSVASNLSESTRIFLAFYLLAHAVINLSLVAALVKKIHIAYPIAVGFFFAFMFYELFRFILHPTVWLAGLLCMDVIIIVSIIGEYRKVMRLKSVQTLLV